MQTRRQIKKLKHNNRTKKAITTSTLALGIGLGLTVVNSNKVDAATWTANSVESIQSALKTNGTTPYKIKWGDTLSTISSAANKNGIETSVARLVEINKISNANLIYAGNQLWFNATNGTVTGKDTNGNNHIYNLNPSKPLMNSNTGSTKPVNGIENSDNAGSQATPNDGHKAPTQQGSGSSNTNTGSDNHNNSSNTGTNNGSSNHEGGQTVNGGNQGGNNDNGGGTVTPEDQIYTPNAAAIKADLMSLINFPAYGKSTTVPTGQAPSGADWISTKQNLSAGGALTSDMAVAQELYAGFLPDNLSDPSYVAAVISNISVSGSYNLTKHTGSVDVSDVTIQWYADPFYGLE